MKKYTLLLLLSIFIFGCKKEQGIRYEGSYTNITGDISTVNRVSEGVISIKHQERGGNTLEFKSVKLDDNYHFKANEVLTDETGRHCVGDGHFSKNEIHYIFTLDNIGHIVFDGVKNQ